MNIIERVIQDAAAIATVLLAGYTIWKEKRNDQDGD